MLSFDDWRLSRSVKTDVLLNLINYHTDTDKKNLYAKEAKYKFSINKPEGVALKDYNDSKAFIAYSNDIDDIYEKIEEYNPHKEREILIVFDDMSADMLSSNKLNPVVTALLIRGRKLNISLVFVTQFCFPASKNIRLNSTNYFIMKIPNKRELQ